MNKQENNYNSGFNFASLFVWFLLIIVSVQFFSIIKSANGPEKIQFTEFLDSVKNKKVSNVTFRGNEIIGEIESFDGKNTKKFITYGDTQSETYLNILMNNGVTPNYIPVDNSSSLWFSAILGFLPLLLIIGFFWFIMRGSKNGMSTMNSFGKIKAKELKPEDPKVTFKDVAGIDESKLELQEIVDFLKNPTKYTNLGGKLPKGVLLVGSPGTGKTLLAKAVAGEAGANFMSISGSDFVEMFVGVGASRVRDLFAKAKAKAPCIIFIDEIDAVGRNRAGGGFMGSNDERDQTLNQLLVEMDGFDSHKGIVIIAATNRVDVLDPALLRAGRFDRRVMVPLPDIQGREEILKIHAQKTKIHTEVSLKEIAKSTAGMSGADLSNLINESALIAARRSHSEIMHSDLEEAKDKILMGPERKSLVISDLEKKTTAYHEAGHTILGKILSGMDNVYKVSIIPRGQALGVTVTQPEENRLTLSKEKAQNMITMLMGGRVAEELIFKHYTTGASNDIQRATQLAKKMVCEWGMSSLGPINFESENNGLVKSSEHSEVTKQLVDFEVSKIINDSYEEARTIIKKYSAELERIALALLEKETLDAQEINNLMKS